MSWEPLSITGWLENIATIEAQTYDIFRRERYLSGLPENPILRLYGHSVRSIMSEDIEPIVNNLLAGMPETEMPQWLRDAFRVQVAFSPLEHSLMSQGADIVITSNDPYRPGLIGRTVSFVSITANDLRNNNFRFPVQLASGERQTWDLNVFFDRQREIGQGYRIFRDIFYDYFVYDVGGDLCLPFTGCVFAVQWVATLFEWLRLAIAKRGFDLTNIPAPEVRIGGSLFAAPLHFGAIPERFGGGIEIGIESPESQRITMFLHNLNDFTQIIGQTEIQISSFRRVRIRPRGLFGRLPPMAISLYPQKQMKVQYVRVLSWFQLW